METKQILTRLNEIKSELHFIKGRLMDIDVILTDDDLASLEEAEKDFKRGKTKRL